MIKPVCYLLFAILLVGLLPNVTGLSNEAHADGPVPIYKIASGLVASDPLTNADGNTADWDFNGSAAELGDAPHSGYEDSQGMHIDVVSPSEGAWRGYFAITPLTAAKLFHAKVILPDQRPATGLTDVAVYVQQEMFQDPRIDAMGCGADIYPNETRWTISLQAGDKDKEIVAQTIYSNNSLTAPNARECTLITNGSNELTAYIDRQKVFSSTGMNLNMPAPFEYYIETQTNSNAPSTGQMFTGTFTDYYATTGASIKVINAPVGSIVRVVDATSGDTLASTAADLNGTAFLDVGMYHMPIDANIMVLDSSGGNILASTAAPAAIYGGDVFNVGDSAQQTATITVNSIDASGEPVDGLFTTIAQGKTVIASGFTPFSFQGLQDSSYYVLMEDDDLHVFDRWDDGSRFTARFITPTTSSVILYAQYADNPGLDAPESLTSLTPYTTNVNSPTITGTASPGLSVQLYDNSSPVGSQATVPKSGIWSIASPVLSDGQHYLYADISNSTARSLLSTPITMTVDTDAPSIAITKNAMADGQISLTGTSSDPLSGIKLVEVGIDNNAASFKTANPLVFGDWSSWVFTTGQMEPGTHRITARATDVAGNQRSASIDVSVPFIVPPGQSLITVNAVDASGTAINGLYTTIQRDNTLIGTAFTPSAFTENNDQDYVVSVSDYGPYFFDHWQDTESTYRHRAVTTDGSSVSLIAVYRDTPLPPPPQGQSALTVNSVNSSGNPISGLYTTLSQSGALVSTGFTAAHFTIDDGQPYVVSVSDYGSNYFDHWQDTGSTARARDVTTSGSSMALVAVYRDTPLPPPPAGKSALTVGSADSGGPIAGLYTTLSQSGSVIATGFTQASFMLDDGQPYVVSVSDYGSYFFDHWQDTGSTTRARVITTSGSPVGIIAVYRDTPLPLPPSGQSALTIISTDSAGKAVEGLYTTISLDGSVVGTGFTPFHFTMTDGQAYVVSVSGYGQFTFDHWQDDGSTLNTRSITPSGAPVSLTAIYNVP